MARTMSKAVSFSSFFDINTIGDREDETIFHRVFYMGYHRATWR
jgi:hypothetical protein